MPSDLRAALGGRPIGIHLPLGAGMVKAADRADAIGAAALQVFADNPTAWRRRTDPPRELPAFRARLAELDLGPTATHAAYLINLAGGDEILLGPLGERAGGGTAHGRWHTGRPSSTSTSARTAAIARRRGIARLAAAWRAALDERRRWSAAPTRCRGGALAALDRSARRCSSWRTARAVAMASGRPWRSWRRSPRPRSAPGFPRAASASASTRPTCGAPATTCRIPPSSTTSCVRFDALLGPRRLAMLHLNDSKVPLGSHGDRHQHLGAGAIGERGMRALLDPSRAWPACPPTWRRPAWTTAGTPGTWSGCAP